MYCFATVIAKKIKAIAYKLQKTPNYS